MSGPDRAGALRGLGAGEDRVHSGHRGRPARVEAHDAGVRVRAPQHRGVEEPPAVDVVEERPRPATSRASSLSGTAAPTQRARALAHRARLRAPARLAAVTARTMLT